MILELNFLVASDCRMFASFQMFQHGASNVSFLKMFMGTIFVIYYKRQAVWVLSFSKSKLLKSFQENIHSRNSIPACQKRKYVTCVRAISSNRLFSRESKVVSEITNFALGSLLHLSLGEKYHITSCFTVAFAAVSCVIPCRYFTLTAQINKSQTLIPRKKISELQSRAKIKNLGFFSSVNRHWPLEKIMGD